MDIEAIVEKYERLIPAGAYTLGEGIRAALTEQAAEYDRKQALLLDAHCERVSSLQERIRQLEAERVPAEIRQFRHPQWADRSRWCDIENPSDEQSLAEAGMVFRTIYAAPRRCHLCNYQHGHQIGCENNPVDIAMLAAAKQPKEEVE